jgi:RNA polymerase primary sigma factor
MIMKKQTRTKDDGVKRAPVDGSGSSVESGGDVDLVTLYMNDISSKGRISREEEKRVAEEIARAKTELTELAGAILWKASDTFAGSKSKRTATGRIGRPVDARRGSERPSLDTYLTALRRASERKGEEGSECAPVEVAVQCPAVGNLSSSQIEAVLDKVAEAANVAGHGADAGTVAEIAAMFALSPAELRRAAELASSLRARLASARDRMIAANLRLVVSLARKFRSRPVDPSDLIQEGNLALMRAVDAFDPRRGFGFATLACKIIRRAMNAFVMANTKPVRVPKQTLELRNRVRRAAWEVGGKAGTQVTPEAVADYLGLDPMVALEALTTHEEGVSLSEGGDGRDDTLANQLVDSSQGDPSDMLEAEDHARQIAELVARLDARDRAVLESRYGKEDDGVTLAETAEGLGVTRERVRQVEARALRRLRHYGSERTALSNVG